MLGPKTVRHHARREPRRSRRRPPLHRRSRHSDRRDRMGPRIGIKV